MNAAVLIVCIIALFSIQAVNAETALARENQPLASPDHVPEGLEKSDWQSIRAAHRAWQHGFREMDGIWQAHNPGQQWTTSFNGRGFIAKPEAADWTWGLKLESYGFEAGKIAVEGRARTSSNGQGLTYHWQNGLEEWFANDQRGLEHGFRLADRPEGAKQGEPLVFTLSTLGSLKPTVSSDTQTVHFRDKAGAPVLNYSGLKVWDANGKALSSRFERASGSEFRLVVEEAGAPYPLTIDPIAQQAYLKAGNNGGPTDDLFGCAVAVSGDTAVVGAYAEDSSTSGVNSTPDESANGAGAAYVFVRSGGVWSQQAYLKASNPGATDLFGSSVAVSGDTVVVGARYEDSGTTGVNSIPNETAQNSGAAYVFVRNGISWSQQAYLKAANTGTNDGFGWAVAVSGDTIIVGADGESSSTTGVNGTPNDSAGQSGAAYVFVRSGTIWSQEAFVKASNTGAGDRFGSAVSISGDTAVVGASGEDSSTTGVNSTPDDGAEGSGAAYVFLRSGGVWSQQAYLKASNTGAGDQFGGSVSVSGDTIVAGASLEDSSTTGVNSTPNDNGVDTGAAYVFVRSGTTWSQQAYLKASNDNFALSVAVSGDTVVIGAPNEDGTATNSGAAYVFVRSGTTWSQQAYLKASNPGLGDYFGCSVAISNDTVVVGSFYEDSNTTGINGTPNEMAADSGAAYVFVRSGTTWSQQAYLKASNTPVQSGGALDQFGFSVAVSGDTVVVGAPYEDSSTIGANSSHNENADGSGAAYVFVRSGTNWSQQAYLKASNTGASDNFGFSVSVSGDTVVVGAPYEDSNTTGVNSASNNSASGSGAAYVFARSGTTWSQQAFLKASNTGANDNFGYSVAVSGDTVVVGANFEDSSTTGVNSAPNEGAADSGASYVFVRSGGVWSQQAYLKASNTGGNDQFGFSVSISGDTVAVGAFVEDSSTTGVNSAPNENALNSGAAYVFARSGGVWSQQAYLKASNTGGNDQFGHSVAVSGDTLVIGARFEDSGTTGVNGTPDENASNSGAAYVFARSGGVWSQQAYLKASNTGLGDEFGYSVSVSGDTVAVGALREDSGTNGVNSSPNENLANAGAAYIFERTSGIWTQRVYLKPANTGAGDLFGNSVSVSSDTVVIGAPFEDSGSAGVNGPSYEDAPDSGAAYIFIGFGPIDIGVEAPTGSEVANGGGTLGFGYILPGGTGDQSITIRNDGTNSLTGISATITGTDSLRFSLVTNPPASLLAGGSATFMVRFAPTSTGVRNAAVSITSNDPNESPFIISLTGIGATAQQAFDGAMETAGLAGQEAQPTAIPYADGVSNLLKYAFNMDLKAPDNRQLQRGTGTAGLPVMETVSGVTRFEFLRRKNSGLIYMPLQTSTLAEDSWQSVTGTTTVVGIDGKWERVVIEQPTGTSRFFRVQVEIP